ncbi:regulator of G-protein signaling 14 isoform X2 [Oryctolagus cuniculus]|uniref:regulator of G-protein signaling 14 isoform X2 n=1 Tax=Oryctolagus cuniculus TaxID=9986 RepID=UPI00222F53F5|nr:regulator of G-protein signaling 14 isoform X2 [Oryctolagus cuniculus]
MPGKPKHLGVPNGRMVLAVSDGELSSPTGSQGQGEGHGSSLSIHSLPSGPSSPFPTEEQPVASWALSFERLLQDPLGLAYFTEFLKKEFSAENVTFWKACERFQKIPASDTKQLAQEARNIYQEFLSSQALSPVNIDRQAWLGEEVLAEPRPDMFRAQQLQIFNLMKFDSYARFVKSPLYRECLLAEAEGRPLREPGSSRLGSPDTTRKKPKLKPGKSLPLGVEELGQLPPAEGPGGRPLRKSFRRELGAGTNSALRRESQGSLNSSASLDLGFLAFVSSKSESQSHRKSLGGPEGESDSRPGKYCCVYLPDGTASLALARPGLTIRDMLAGICEKRGLSLPDIKVFLVGNEQAGAGGAGARGADLGQAHQTAAGGAAAHPGEARPEPTAGVAASARREAAAGSGEAGELGGRPEAGSGHSSRCEDLRSQGHIPPPQSGLPSWNPGQGCPSPFAAGGSQWCHREEADL